MLEATLKVTGAAAMSAVPTMSPEVERELSRTETDMRMEDGTAVIHITASDSTAMRAALNSHLECLRVIESIETLTKVKQ